MTGVLIVSRHRAFRETCRTLLRKKRFKMILSDDMIEGMKELTWYRPDLIIWEMEPKILREMKVLSVLRNKYPRIPLLLIVEDENYVDLLREFSVNILVKELGSGESISPAELSNRINKLLGNLATFPVFRTEIN